MKLLPSRSQQVSSFLSPIVTCSICGLTDTWLAWESNFITWGSCDIFLAEGMFDCSKSSLTFSLHLTVLTLGVWAFQRNRSLRELLLGNNYITDSSLADLIEALGVHPCLEKVLNRLPSVNENLIHYKHPGSHMSRSISSFIAKRLQLSEKVFHMQVSLKGNYSIGEENLRPVSYDSLYLHYLKWKLSRMGFSLNVDSCVQWRVYHIRCVGK